MRFVECTVHRDRVMKFLINFYNHIAFLYDHHTKTNFNKSSRINKGVMQERSKLEKGERAYMQDMSESTYRDSTSADSV